MNRGTPPPPERWSSAQAAQHYRLGRWSSARKAQRDPQRIGSILAHFLPPDATALLLDAPCGTGRIRPTLEAHGSYLGLDVSAAMLTQARQQANGRLVRGDIQRLPFRDDAFAAVICCRLLHHLDEAALTRSLCELVRVSRGLIVASFWDAASLPEWKRRVLPSARASRRIARSKIEIARALAACGANVLAWRHSLRFVSRQAFVVARKRPRALDRDRAGALAHERAP